MSDYSHAVIICISHLEVNSAVLLLSLLLSSDLLSSADVSRIAASFVVLVYSTHTAKYLSVSAQQCIGDVYIKCE